VGQDISVSAISRVGCRGTDGRHGGCSLPHTRSTTTPVVTPMVLACSPNMVAGWYSDSHRCCRRSVCGGSAEHSTAHSSCPSHRPSRAFIQPCLGQILTLTLQLVSTRVGRQRNSYGHGPRGARALLRGDVRPKCVLDNTMDCPHLMRSHRGEERKHNRT
jgi:hypothetical protein